MQTAKASMNRMFLLISVVLCGPAFGAPEESFQDLPPRIQYWAGYPLRDIHTFASPGDVYRIVSNSTRSAAYKAAGLLFRDAGQDRVLASKILNKIAERQYLDPNDKKSYGSFRKNLSGEAALDENWREFIGQTFIVVLEEFSDRIPEALQARMKSALVHAARGAMWRNVGADYSNVAIQSAFLMEYAGRMANLPDVCQLGQEKAKAIYDAYMEHDSLSEFNSPTYAGVSLVGLACWRKYGASEQTRHMGEELEMRLWEDVADFYNPALRNLCGPYFRSYNMDMTRCNTPAGACIAVAVNDADWEPLPATPGVNNFELDLMPLIVLTRKTLPEHLTARFKTKTTSRLVRRDVYNRYPGERIKRVTAMITPDWMMSGATGHRRPWDQIFPGTLQWRNVASRHINWLLIPSKFKTDIVVDETSMTVLTGGMEDEKLQLLVSAPSISRACFQGSRWNLPGLSLEVTTDLIGPEIRELTGEEVRKYAHLAAVPDVPANTGKMAARSRKSPYEIWAIEYVVPSRRSPETPLIKFKPVSH